MNEEVLYNAEELLMHEIDDIVDAKRNGKQLSMDDICCLEKMLKGVESINRTLMLQQADRDYNEDPMAFEERTTRNGYGYGSSRANNGGYNSSGNYYTMRGSYANRGGYNNRRSGHDDARAVIESKMNSAIDERERMVYQNLLSELDRR